MYHASGSIDRNYGRLYFQMKSLLLIPLLMIGSMPSMARDYSQGGGTRQTQCYENVYREEYVPGTRGNPGYVRRHNERVEVPCRDQGYSGGVVPQQYTESQNVDDNSCIEGSILGGIAGAALGASLSRDEGMFIGIPAGIVGGALVGCQLDGG